MPQGIPTDQVVSLGICVRKGGSGEGGRRYKTWGQQNDEVL